MGLACWVVRRLVIVIMVGLAADIAVSRPMEDSSAVVVIMGITAVARVVTMVAVEDTIITIARMVVITITIMEVLAVVAVMACVMQSYRYQEEALITD